MVSFVENVLFGSNNDDKSWILELSTASAADKVIMTNYWNFVTSTQFYNFNLFSTFKNYYWMFSLVKKKKF